MIKCSRSGKKMKFSSKSKYIPRPPGVSISWDMNISQETFVRKFVALKKFMTMTLENFNFNVKYSRNEPFFLKNFFIGFSHFG